MTAAERSIELCEKIQNIIASRAPVVGPAEGEPSKQAAGPDRLPFYADNPDGTLQRALNTFLIGYLLLPPSAALSGPDEGFYHLLYRQARRFSASQFLQDPYLKAVRDLGGPHTAGDFTLTMASYEAGELFAYDAPLGSGYGENVTYKDSAGLVVPQLGFFDRKVSFPAVYQGQIPWMSLCPSEVNTMKAPVEEAVSLCRRRFRQEGRPCRVLALGLGLGYFPFLLLQEECVGDVDVVEWSPEIISLFERFLKPCFPHRARIHVIQGDAYEYLHGVEAGQYDFVFADTWESQFDGAKDYLRLVRQKKRLAPPAGTTGFSCWIEPQIKAYLSDMLKSL